MNSGKRLSNLFLTGQFSRKINSNLTHSLSLSLFYSISAQMNIPSMLYLPPPPPFNFLKLTLVRPECFLSHTFHKFVCTRLKLVAKVIYSGNRLNFFKLTLVRSDTVLFRVPSQICSRTTFKPVAKFRISFNSVYKYRRRRRANQRPPEENLSYFILSYAQVGFALSLLNATASNFSLA